MQTLIQSQQHSLPNFSTIQAKDIKAAVEQLIMESKTFIDQLVSSDTVSYNELVIALEQQDDKLNRLWSPISHMNSVVSSDELREAHDACLPLLSEYGTWVGQHKGLYNAFKTLRLSDEFNALSTAQKTNIDNTLRDFTLSGVALSERNKQKYAQLQSRLSELSSQFSNNVLDATMGWTKLVTDEAALSGLPESAIAAAAQAAERKAQKGWLFTLDIPSYLPVMMYADDRSLRQEMYTAFTTRASDQGPNALKYDNSAIIEETLALRQQVALLLDFDSYAERSLATKMADSPQQVIAFLEDLAVRSKTQAEQDLTDVRSFAKQLDGADDLQAWDLTYYSEKLKQQRYSISDEELRPYFPESKVVSGLFAVVSKLYGLTISPRDDVDRWHKDVSFLRYP